jgi:uncharacterized protein (TIGR00251 family)
VSTIPVVAAAVERSWPPQSSERWADFPWADKVPPVLRPRPDGAVDLDVHAVPRSSRDAIGKPHDGRLKLHIKSPPVDGEANAALIKLLAKTLELPREAIELTHGQTGKRKTVRIRGLALAEITTRLGLTCMLVLASACENPRELPITVILPADQSDYERADNATVVMRPSGESFSWTIDDGSDFRLELEGEPTTETQQLELYLADGEDLIAWGRTASFSTAGPDVGLALFLGRPGLLSTWPDTLDTPDPDVLASEALGRGMLLVEDDGDTFLLNHYTLELESGERLPDTVGFANDDGGLFSAADGSVVRLAFEQVEPLAWRYDPASDAWTELSVDASAEIGLRPGAAVLSDPDRSRVYLLGGGGATDAIAIDLVANEDDTLAAAPVSAFELDAPRDHATALWIPQADNPTADVLLVGADALGPVAALASTGTSIGASLDWRDLACAIESTLDTATTVLCVGGTLEGLPTANALRIEIVAGAATVEILADFLPAPLPDPRLLHDDFALYAQGEARWFRISRDGGDVSEPESAPLRGTGGSCVALANGVTFLVGGVDRDGAALDRWQVFTPAIEP